MISSGGHARHMRRTGLVVTVLALRVMTAHADGNPGFTGLEHALPNGWTMLATDTELVLRHDRPCFRTEDHGSGAPRDGALVTLELRYRLEPRWTPAQHAEAKHANDAIAAELKALRERYKIDAIHPAKATPEEHARLDAYQKAATQVERKAIKEPMCALDTQSIFDGDETYAGLKQPVDPPEALKEARAVVELVKQHCGAR
jgi:hypothetical protein